jgi:AhpD family alkylhydroperoxidase
MSFFPSIPEDATQSEIFKRWPELAEPLGMLAQRLLRDGPFTHEQAELIFAFTSGVNACQYCHNIHRHTAELFGVEAGMFEALLDDIDLADIDEKMKPLLKYVRKLTETSSKMIQADADAVLLAGWSETEFQYAISICAAANYFNRILEGHGIKGDPALWRQRGQLLAENDYVQIHKAKVE